MSNRASRSQSATSRFNAWPVAPGFDHVSCTSAPQPAVSTPASSTTAARPVMASLEDEHAAADGVRVEVLVRAIDLGQRVAPLDEAGHVDEPAPDPVGDARHVLARMGGAVIRAGQRLLPAREHD